MTVLDLDKFEKGQPELIFHYTSAVNVAAILESGVLRLSSLKGLNDPRESKDYIFPIRGDLDVDIEEARRRLGAINDLVQSNVYVASFTVDETDAPYEDGTGQARRGFARARNWDQYADHHRGAVLAFDRHVLERELRAQVDDIEAAKLHYSDLRRDWLADGNLFAWDSGHLEPDRAWEAAQLIMSKEHRGQFFMTKFEDWASEREFRLLAFTAIQPQLPIAEAFSGIVLGQSFPQPEEKVLGSRLLRLGVGDTMVAKMSWEGGTIGAYPMGHALPNLKWPGTEGINGLVRPVTDSITN